MASFQKYGKGWRVFIKRRGVSKSATFQTKREAQDWAIRVENLILSEPQEKKKIYKFSELIDRYLDEYLDKRRNQRDARYRLEKIKRYPIANKEISEESILEFRQQRLTEVQAPTVNRDMTILSHVCTIAVKEWRWLESNPFFNVSKPKNNLPRDRRVTEEEIERLKLACAYEASPVTLLQYACHAFLFAIETAMRAGEIQSLTWDNINLEKRTAFLPMTKNGTSRKVPLSSKAIALIKALPRLKKVFYGNLVANFFRLKTVAGFDDLHFHDSRHEAITRLSRKLDVLTLARVVGHKNIKQLMTYYNESAEDIAQRLE